MDLQGWLPSWLARLVPRRRHLKVAVAREKGKNRSGTFTVLTFSAAGVAFVLALFGVGPFAVQALVVSFSSGQVAASDVFPAVSPTVKTVVVFDPPKPAPAGNPPKASPSPSPSPSRSPRPSHSPWPSPPPDN